MSYASSNNNKRTMHCNVCHSARKPLSIVTSHYPKNREGNTVCPTLLSQECRLCGKKGHTVKYCTKEQPKEQTRDKERPRDNKERSRINKEQQAPIKKRVLEVFNVLYESSDDEETRQEPNQEEEKQEKKKAKKVKDPNAKFCWATAESDSSGESESDSD